MQSLIRRIDYEILAKKYICYDLGTPVHMMTTQKMEKAESKAYEKRSLGSKERA